MPDPIPPKAAERKVRTFGCHAWISEPVDNPSQPPDEAGVVERLYETFLWINSTIRPSSRDPKEQRVKEAIEAALFPPPVAEEAGMREPVAYRWRYLRDSGPDHWHVRQTPIEPSEGSETWAGVEVEPLYLAPPVAPTPPAGEAVERFRGQNMYEPETTAGDRPPRFIGSVLFDHDQEAWIFDEEGLALRLADTLNLPSSALPSRGLTIPDEAKDVLERMKLEDELREREGESVTIVCDNPDFNGQPPRLIICVGEWTDWEERRFPGDTVIDCLRQAAEARRQALSNQEPSHG